MGSRVLVSLPAAAAMPKQRLRSLDALRGFAMFWLIGGREFSLGLVAWLHPSLVDAVEDQLTHPKWRGFVAWDLVMPVFLFLVGTSMPFSLAKRCEEGLPLSSTYWRVARRVAVLWVLGLITQVVKYNAEGMELYSNALQAIAVGYLVTSLALLHLRGKGQIGLFVSLVLGYGALLMFVPFGGHPAGTVERTANLPRYIEELVLGRFSSRSLLYVGVDQSRLRGHRPLGSNGGTPSPNASVARTQAALAGDDRFGVHGHRMAVELLAPLEPPPLDQFDDPLGRGHQLLVAGVVLCRD